MNPERLYADIAAMAVKTNRYYYYYYYDYLWHRCRMSDCLNLPAAAKARGLFAKPAGKPLGQAKA